VDLLVRDNLAADVNRIKSMNGNMVRAVAIFWNTLGTKYKYYGELAHLEPEPDLSSLILDDMVGYVRARNKVSFEVLDSLYDISNLALPDCLKEENGSIVYVRRTVSRDPVIREFLTQRNHIARARAQIISQTVKTLLPSPVSLFDRTKLSIMGIADLLVRYEKLRQILLHLIKMYDESGEPGSWNSTIGIGNQSGDSYRKELRLMKDLHLVQVTDGQFSVTETGLEAAYLAVRSDLQERFKFIGEDKKQRFVSAEGLQKITGIPLSLIIRGFDDADMISTVSPAMIAGKPTKLFWITACGAGDSQVSSEINKSFVEIRSHILRTIDEFHFPTPVPIRT
jgi:hypothetical protein